MNMACAAVDLLKINLLKINSLPSERFWGLRGNNRNPQRNEAGYQGVPIFMNFSSRPYARLRTAYVHTYI